MTSQLKMLKDLADELKDAKSTAGRAEWHFRMHRYLSFKAATATTKKQPTEEESAALAVVAETIGVSHVDVANLNKAQRIAKKLTADKLSPGEARYIVEQQRFEDIHSDSEESSENLQPQ